MTGGLITKVTGAMWEHWVCSKSIVGPMPGSMVASQWVALYHTESKDLATHDFQKEF